MSLVQVPYFIFVFQISSLHSRYLELLTHSSDYCKSLGDSLKNLEELKVHKVYLIFIIERAHIICCC